MNTPVPPGGRISASRLARVLGDWRRGGSRQGAADLLAAIELQILDGQLPLGTMLPAERQLADALGVSRTLVGAALDQLRARELVASRRGAGSWITAPGPGTPAAARARDPDLIDFARASPPAIPGMLPAVDAARCRLVGELSGHGYSDRGLPELRERIAERYTVRGLPTTPEQIMVTNGAHHAFVLALRTFIGPGDRILVEQPTYPNALEAVRAAHAIGVPVPVDAEHGWDIAGLEAALRQAAPRLAYLIVDFHNPTGLRMDAEDRQRLGSVLARSRTPAVVDETIAELDLDGDPVAGPPPLAAFAEDWVITVGSAAKTFWGGLRLGWLRAPEELIGRMLGARCAVDLGSPVFEQYVLTELLTEPDERLRQRRADTLARRDELVAAVRSYCPDWTFRVPGGGLSLWCRFPEPMSTRLAVAAGNRGLQVAPGPRFGVHGGLERWMKLPFTLPSQRLTEAVHRLSLAAAAVQGSVVDSEGLDIAVS